MTDPCRAIENLVYTYAERIDRADFEGVAALFERARVSIEGRDGAWEGRDQVLEMYRSTTRVHEDTGTLRTRHVTTNLIIEVDPGGPGASCRSYYTVFQQTPDLPLQAIIAGRYRDRFSCEEGQWRFSERHIYCDLFGDLSQHLRFDLAALANS